MEFLNRPHGAVTLKVLLRAGIRPNAKDSQGRTALMVLVERDALSVYEDEEEEARERQKASGDEGDEDEEEERVSHSSSEQEPTG